MSEETLHTAARRALREFRIADVKDGGLIGVPLIQAMNTLDLQIEKENEREKERAKADQPKQET